MKIDHQAQLRPYNTFGIPSVANRLVTLESVTDFSHLISSGLLDATPFFVLGGGSNVVLPERFEGTMVRVANKGTQIHSSESQRVLVEAEAGTVWDTFVRYTLQQGLYGLENLVSIPGTVGASAVQNVGAYGVEAKDVIHSVKAFEIATGHERIFTVNECDLSYRNSIFKQELNHRYLISSVVFRLSTQYRPQLSYQGLVNQLDQLGVSNPSALQVAEVVTHLRQSKLPDPQVIGSAGSFFKNPVVSAAQHDRLLLRFPNLVSFPLPDGSYKLSAAWLIDQAGWKGKSMGRAGVYEKQPLVLVNRGGCDAHEVRVLAQAVMDDVMSRFGVQLSPEAIFVS